MGWCLHSACKRFFNLLLTHLIHGKDEPGDDIDLGKTNRVLNKAETAGCYFLTW